MIDIIKEMMKMFVVIHNRLLVALILYIFNFVTHIVTNNVRDKSLNEGAH